MRALLDDLNSLPGVLGSMYCDAGGGVLSRAFPPEFDDGSLTAVASALATATPELKSLTGTISVLDLRYRETRVVIRPAGDASLLVLCDKKADAQEILAFASVACKKFERLQLSGTSDATNAPVEPATGPSGSAPVGNTNGAPVPEQSAPGPGAVSVAAPVVEPPARRRVPVAMLAAVAALALVVGAGIAYALRGPRPPAAVRVEPTALPTPPPPQEPPTLGPLKVKLRLSGSDTLAAELAPALAAGFLSAQKAVDVQIVHPGPELIVVRGLQDGAAVGVEIKSLGTAQGLDDLLAGTADVALAARRANAEERQRLAALGDLSSTAREHVVGVDGITVVVNKANPVPSLNREQLRTILSGAISDWSRLGGAEGSATQTSIKEGPVHVYLPDDRSTIPEVVRAIVLGGGPFTPDARRLPTPQAVAEAVRSDPGGMGLVPMAGVAGARAVPIADQKGPPRLPTALAVASEDYLLAHRLYLYTSQASLEPLVAQFVEFALSAEGQTLVRRAGFVELGAKTETRRAGAPVGPAMVASRRLARAAGPTPVELSAPPERADPPATTSAQGDPVGTASPNAVAPPPPPLPSPQPPPIAVEDAPVYATGNYQKPKMVEQGCVQRTVRMPNDVFDRVAEKTITVKFVVGREGTPSRFQVMTPGMPDRAGTAIWEAIQACTWIPGADEGGVPLSIWVIMPFRFTRE